MSGIDFELLEVLPVRVKGVGEQGLILHMFGDQWGLELTSPWEGAIGGRAISSEHYEDDYINELALDLIGQDLVAVRQEGLSVRFEFSAASLVVTPDSDYEPWVLTLPSGIFVGEGIDTS
jgi:hypothetical protein